MATMYRTLAEGPFFEPDVGLEIVRHRCDQNGWNGPVR